MKTIFEQLKEEHTELANQIDELLDTGDDEVEERAELIVAARNQLLAHSEAEQAEFYPRAQELDDEIADQIEQGLADHAKVEDLLDQLEEIGVEDPEFLDTVEQLKETVARHVDEEENELFPRLQQYLDDDEATEIGERFRRERERQLDALQGMSAQGQPGDLEEMTKRELYERARQRGVPGRSRMSRDELIHQLKHR